MSDKPEKSKRSLWSLLNAVLPLVAFAVIGYIVWVASNAKPHAVPVAAALDVLVANDESPDERTDAVSNVAAESDVAKKWAPETEDKSPSVSAADTGKIEPPEPSKATTDPPSQSTDDNSGGKEPAAVPVLSADTSEKPVPNAKTAPTADPVTTTETEPVPVPKPKVALGPAPDFYNVAVAKFLFEKKCSECHKLKRVENHAFADVTAVEGLIDKMVENGLEVNDKERSFLDYYVQSTFVD